MVPGKEYKVNSVVYGGPMFSGKTTALVRRYDLLIREGTRVLLVKPLLDTRYDSHRVITHDGVSRPCAPIADPREILRLLRDLDADVVMIDEVSLFDAESIAKVLPSLRYNRVPFFASGFDLWHDGRINLAWAAAAGIADTTLRMVSRCVCGQTATHTFRKMPAEEDVDVGGDEKYEPRCYDCWSKGVKR